MEVTVIWPPMRSTRDFEIARPRPVPSFFRFFFVSTWEKEPKSLPRSSSLMPWPVSSMAKVRRRAVGSSGFILFSTFIESRTYPSSVNLMALFAIFVMTWRTRILSP